MTKPHILLSIIHSRRSHWIWLSSCDTEKHPVELNYSLMTQKTSHWIQLSSYDTEKHPKLFSIPLVLWICCHLPKPVSKYHSHRRSGWQQSSGPSSKGILPQKGSHMANHTSVNSSGTLQHASPISTAITLLFPSFKTRLWPVALPQTLCLILVS